MPNHISQCFSLYTTTGNATVFNTTDTTGGDTNTTGFNTTDTTGSATTAVVSLVSIAVMLVVALYSTKF